MTYKLHKDARTGNVSCVIKTNEDGSTHSFVIDENVSSYQAYLKWLDAGGVVLEADASAEESNTQG